MTTETEEVVKGEYAEFVPTHRIRGIPVRREGNFPYKYYDRFGGLQIASKTNRAIPIAEGTHSPQEGVVKVKQVAAVTERFNLPSGEVIEYGPKIRVPDKPQTHVKLAPEVAACILRAATWPDPDAPVGYAAVANGHDASLAAPLPDGRQTVKVCLAYSKGQYRVILPDNIEFELVQEG